MAKNPLPQDAFYDINHLPKGYGILVFPISIVRAESGLGQSPIECLEYVKYFSPSKVVEPKIGLNMIYSDFLYMNSDERADSLKQKFMSVVLKHKNGFKNLLEKEWGRFQIQHAFSYEVWNQLYLSYGGDFNSDFHLIKKWYLEDEIFQGYLREDADHCAGRELSENQINFFLEEHLMMYLVSKKQILLPNEYVQGRERWVIWCYPGVPLKGQVYLYQKNPLKLESPENPYQNHFYDLESKKLIDFTRIDLQTYDYRY